jgi:hypothetical protein
MCLTAEEAKIVNKTFNSEEYYRKSDSLCYIRWRDKASMVEAYETILELDSLNDTDRLQQAINLKEAYDNCNGRISLMKDEVKEWKLVAAKQRRRKKFWKTTTIAFVPAAFVGGFFVALKL